MKKILVVGLVLVTALGAFARPGGGPGGGRGPHHPPPMHHHGHHSDWGRGGRHFWPGFVGGVVGGVVCGALSHTYVEPAPVIVTQPTVVTTPVVTQPVVVQQPTVVAPVQQTQNVWVEGRYVDQVQSNGTVIRVWQPGHYEQRVIVM